MPRRRSRKKNKNSKSLLYVFGILLFIIAAGTVYLVCFSKYNVRNREKTIKGDTKFLSYVANFTNYSVFGIDVSEYQGNIDWKAAAEEKGMKFVFIRATAGNDKIDRNFVTNWYAAKEQGLIRGAYHYYRPDENSTGQAQNFIETVQLKQGDLPPILDIEEYSRVQNTNSLKSGLLNWLTIVEKHYGITPILYTAPNIYKNQFAGDSRFNKYTVWISYLHISKTPDKIAPLWKFWQFSHTGIVNGIKGKVDVNLYKGTYDELLLETKP